MGSDLDLSHCVVAKSEMMRRDDNVRQQATMYGTMRTKVLHYLRQAKII